MAYFATKTLFFAFKGHMTEVTEIFFIFSDIRFKNSRDAARPLIINEGEGLPELKY